MALKTLSNRLMQNDESVDRQKTRNALLHLDTPHLFYKCYSKRYPSLCIWASIERTYFVTYYVNNDLQKIAQQYFTNNF